MSILLPYSDIIERMKSASGLKNDSAVARVLKITPQALSNYKKRSTIPSHLIINFAALYGISVDWLLTGRGHFRTGGGGGPIATNSTLDAAMENNTKYTASGNPPENLQLTPEELIYIGKLLSLLRSGNDAALKTLKFNIDAFFSSKGCFKTSDT